MIQTLPSLLHNHLLIYVDHNTLQEEASMLVFCLSLSASIIFFIKYSPALYDDLTMGPDAT